MRFEWGARKHQNSGSFFRANTKHTAAQIADLSFRVLRTNTRAHSRVQPFAVSARHCPTGHSSGTLRDKAAQRPLALRSAAE